MAKVKSNQTIKLKVKPTTIKLKATTTKSKSKVKSKSKSKSNLPEEKMTLLKKTVIGGSTLLAVPLATVLLNEAVKKYKDTYNFGLGYKEERKNYKNEKIDLERALNKKISFKTYMEDKLFDYNCNYIQDANIIKTYNEKNLKDKIKSLYEYIKYGKQKINVDPIRPYYKDYYKST